MRTHNADLLLIIAALLILLIVFGIAALQYIDMPRMISWQAGFVPFGFSINKTDDGRIVTAVSWRANTITFGEYENITIYGG